MKSLSKVTKGSVLTYSHALRLAKIAETQVAEAIVRARAELGSPELVRGRMDEPRFKSQASINRKAKERGCGHGCHRNLLQTQKTCAFLRFSRFQRSTAFKDAIYLEITAAGSASSFLPNSSMMPG